MDENKDTIDRLVKLQLNSLLTHLSKGHFSMAERLAAAQATSALTLTSRLQAGEAVDISRITEGPNFEDALAQLDGDQ